jgi:hypothetical protein
LSGSSTVSNSSIPTTTSAQFGLYDLDRVKIHTYKEREQEFHDKIEAAGLLMEHTRS